MAKTRVPNGQGTYVKRGDRQFEWRQNVDGVRRSVSATSMKDLVEKVNKLKDRPMLATKTTVDMWFQRWLTNYVEALTKPATYQQYKIMYDKHVKPDIGSRRIGTIEPHDIQGVIATANKAGLSSWTMKHIRKVLHLGFEKALEMKLVASNPVTNISIPKKTPKEQKVLTAEETGMILNALEKSRWKASFKFMLATGIRRGELLALTWSDIDYDGHRIRVDQSLSADGTPGDTKSSNIHYVPLSKPATVSLDEQKVMLMKEGNMSAKGTGLVFPNQCGKPLHPASYTHMLSKLFDNKKDGIHVYPHALRHTFVYLSRGDLSLKDLQSVLGHSSSTTTLDIYGDIINDNAGRMVSAMDGVMDKFSTEIDAAMKKKADRESGKNVVKIRKKKAQ